MPPTPALRRSLLFLRFPPDLDSIVPEGHRHAGRLGHNYRQSASRRQRRVSPLPLPLPYPSPPAWSSETGRVEGEGLRDVEHESSCKKTIPFVPFFPFFPFRHIGVRFRRGKRRVPLRIGHQEKRPTSFPFFPFLLPVDLNRRPWSRGRRWRRHRRPT